MAERILQLNFKFSVTKAEYEQAAASLASEFADVAGLRWKVWLMNEAESVAGGIYLFDSDSSLQAFFRISQKKTARKFYNSGLFSLSCLFLAERLYICNFHTRL